MLNLVEIFCTIKLESRLHEYRALRRCLGDPTYYNYRVVTTALVLVQLRLVTDGWTDERTRGDSKYGSSLASRG